MKKIILTMLVFTASTMFALDIGDTIPSFAFPATDNVYHFSKNYVGQGWLICDFFATFCEPCKKEVPELNDIYNRFKDKGLQVLLFASDKEGRNIVIPYFTAMPVDFTVLIDRYGKAVESFGVENLPTLFLIDPEGKVVLRENGYDEEKGLSKVVEILEKVYQE